MATNDFLTFAGSAGSNVITQAAYAALAAQQTGFQAGVANSAQLNKVWRQSSIMAAVLGQFIADYSGQNAVDDGTTATLETNLKSAINAAGITAPQFDNSTKLSTTAWVWNNIQSLVSSCISAVATSAGFASSIGTNGYVKFPSWLGGWIFQWGLANITGNTDYSVSFPISFTTAVYSITNSNGYTQGSGTINAPVVVGVSPSLSSFVLRSTNNTSVYWMAAGK
ncbi:hypothetical protein R77569_04567 [Ralstonia mannitolilytica]|uniref:Putative tail fiber protein gp53-like C-terminal domain-containing protein n=1 Tax=Ralstonia mannitolilytica TaxID=105219 RepID=A0ABN9KKQ0_9RALS|nr:hypothetical protein [Ralstonia mannitolilytica]CAJ0896137.1 hypothetical protein R77569_04567 [Ralstonia mannitolilytica]